jgi:hypothetical protein
MKTVWVCLWIVCSASLVACGGGGGGASSPSSTTSTSPVTSFPLRAGFQSYLGRSESNAYTITGTCSGSATETRSAASSATFEGQYGVSTTSTISGTFTNCTPASVASTSSTYYDTNYKPIGSAVTGTEYSIITTISDLPLSVSVGDTALLGTAVVYTNNAKTSQIGTTNLSYAVESDTASTAILNLISKRYNPSNQLLFTQQSRYRINGNGQLTAVSIDVQYSTTSTTHLLWTKN